MSFRLYLVTVMMPLCVCKSSECRYKNISCNSIQTPGGYEFRFECTAGIEIYIYCNQTVIAFAKLQKQSYTYSPEVTSMDHSSIVTRQCRDLRTQCILSNGKYVSEACEEIQVTEAVAPDAGDVTAPWDLIITVSLVVLVGIAMLCWCWKKRPVWLQSSCCAKEGICQFRHHEGRGVQDVPRRDFSIEMLPLGPHGSGENDVNGNEQDTPAEPVHADGGDASDLDDGRTFPHRVRNRNMRDDPGGVHTVRAITTHDGDTRGARGPEGRPLLLDQRAAAHGSDVTGETAGLVNKHCFDPHQVSRSSTALDNDAESHPRSRTTEA